MSISIGQLRERVAKRFPDVEQVGDSIIRSVRRAGKKPFAVYYFDIAQNLPETQETLTSYQDQVIGARYFEGEKSLQWSNYLFFITDRTLIENDKVRHARELIERDRSYARKFVISEDELDSVLSPAAISPTPDPTPHASILTLWTDRLIEAGLDKAVLSDDDLPARVRLIENSSTTQASRRKARSPRSGAKPVSFMKSLDLKKFRDFPIQRHFKFGNVNLIFGVNGSGKTSLLEAIELFYCGQNKRNGDAPSYELIAGFVDGRSESATNRRPIKEFRERNLAWYGQSEVRTNNLCLSFAQFNFLDTDAAVGLSTDKDIATRIEEDLSKLLIGADASKTWREIERTNVAVASKLRELSPLEKQAQEELASLEKQEKDASVVQPESNAIRARFEEMINRLGWGLAQTENEAFPVVLLETLPELVSIVQQALAIEWAVSPISLFGLSTYCTDAKVLIEKVEPDITTLELLQMNDKDHTDALKREREALTLVTEAKRAIDAGVSDRSSELIKLRNTAATYSDWIAGLVENWVRMFLAADLELTVPACYAAAVSRLSSAEQSLDTAKREYANFSELRDQSLRLAQELREAAAKILQTSLKPDECPLCHTNFQPGELAKHINADIDAHTEASAQALLTRLREREEGMRNGTTLEGAASWLMKFCERANLSPETSVRVAFSEVEKAKGVLTQARLRSDALVNELTALETEGLSSTRLAEISEILKEGGYLLPELSRAAVDLLISDIHKAIGTSLRTIETETKVMEELQKTLATTLGSVGSDVRTPRIVMSRLKERLATTESLQTKLMEFFSSFPWAAERSLAELSVEAESVRKVASDLQVAVAKELQARAIHSESVQRKQHLQAQLNELRPRTKRLADAMSALDRLQAEHSLKTAMESALQQNRAGIEAIFTHIHSPAEFSGLGAQLTTLVRKANSKETSLSEISTGQRAAFALSIFLAQNAKLTAAPPVILIDDPIAHVDDLNSLSFLDYLRDVALMGQRQIFFATASDKLATLFERKFDFLGSEGFCRFDLRRET
jgi:DNA repair protein SbcC/Rad50